ncbi:unnamed protein product [Phytophthora fragariaefolia]|uniref:Unnamed protein product n=1 Tax=Phytophthora fragariaefolia TaxID=1490495 RepID=A0A9W6XWP8_9STRA|nr:unnamed protein product [Phytophthora fragariaefolia]
MAIVANLVSEHSCELIYDQYVYAIGGRANYTYYEPVQDIILIQNVADDEDALDEPQAEFSVNKRSRECSCLFMTARLLPCRHVFLRNALFHENVIPTQLLNPRWMLAGLWAESHIEEVSGNSFGIARVLGEKYTPWDSNRKYREAHVVASSISDAMSGLGMPQYLVAMEALKQVVKKFKHGAFSDLADLAQHDSIKTQESGGIQSRSTCSSPETVPPTNCFSPETEPPTVPSTELNPEEAPSNEDKVPAIGGMPDRVAGVLDYGNSTVGCVTTVHSELVVQPSEKCTQPTGVCTQTDSGIAPHQVDLNLKNTEFDIASPGRPKVKPKSVKAKRNLGIALAAEDAETFDSQLSLASAAQVVANAPTYN